MKIFILGDKGFLGSHLLLKLQSLGHDVITDLRYWDERYDVVINLAAKTHLRMEFDPQLIESNYILADKVFKRSERILYASSCSAKHNTNPYAASKLWSEHLGEKHGNAVGLRFHNIYGSGGSRGIVWFLMQQPDGAKITIRGAELVRDYVYVDDVVDAIIHFMNPDPVYVDASDINDSAHTYSYKQLRQMAATKMDGLPLAFKIPPAIEVIDIGTGIGTTTLGLVQLYRELSGKHFELEFAPAGDNEPLKMIADRRVPNAIDLETGLKLLIKKNKNHDKDSNH